MHIEAFLALLKNVRKAGPDKWMACCPAHNDTHSKTIYSLTIKHVNCAIDLKCRKGCSILNILKALKLAPGDLLLDDEYLASLVGKNEIDYDDTRDLLIEVSNNQYTVINGAFHQITYNREGEKIEKPICNFTARIIEDIFKDNGASINRFLKMQGRLNGFHLPIITLPEAQFEGMKWPRREWGFKVQVIKNRSNEDHLVNAITFSSGRVPERTVYTHTGWREIDGQFTYLTAGGAIGMPALEVELPVRLAHYKLPQPDGDPRLAIEKSLDILIIAEPSVTIPTFILPYLSVLNCFEDMSFTAWYAGESGAFKSVLTALALSHFGKFTHKSIPVNWFGTRTELEKLSFLAKDILFAIDDYAPPADSRDAREINKTVEYMLRAFGNRQGKVRSNADLSSQETFYPRGLLVTSGEQLPPPSVSRSARIIPIPVKKSDFFKDDAEDFYMLSTAQKDAAYYPLAMAHYIKWIIDNRPQVEADFHAAYDKYRAEAPKKNVHLRLVDTIALMQTGFCIATEFACIKGALKESSRDAAVKESWDVLAGLLNRQNIQITSEKPAVRFIEVLQSLLASGRAAFRSRNDSGEWSGVQTTPGQALIGWADLSEDVIYLNRDESYSLVYNHCQRIGQFYGTHPEETWQNMKSMGFLEGREKDDPPTITKKIQGSVIRVLPVKRSVIYPGEGENI